MHKGRAFFAAGNFEKARVEFRNALQIMPSSSDARYQNGVVDEKLGNPREAAQFYQGAIDSNSDNVRARAALGRLFLFAGAPERAMSIIKPAFVKHPADAELLTVRAAARVQLKDQSGALQDAERAVQLAPANENSVAVLAGIYQSQGQLDQARAALESGIKQMPSTIDLRLVLARIDAGSGRRDQAEALLIDLVRLQPHEPAHRLRLAQFYAGLKQIDAAERVLRDGITALPGDRQLKVALIGFLAVQRSRDAADRQLNAFIAADPGDYQLKFALGQFYELGKDFDKAAEVYRQIIAAQGLDEAGLNARNHLASLLIEQNNSTVAEKLIGEVLAKDPRNNDALILQGNLALAHKDPKTAIADLRAVLRDQPNAIGVMRALARAHLANGEPALAEQTMRNAVEVNPKDVGARLDLAQLLIQLGKPEQARPIVDELVKQQPDNIQALDAQFKVALANKDIAAATAAADAMVAIQPKQPIGYIYKARIGEAAKRFDDAVRLYSKALELAPDVPEPLQELTRVLVLDHRAPEALLRLDQAIAAYPKIPLAANLKGEVLLSLQRTAEAIPIFKMAIARNPKWWLPYHDLALAEWASNDSSAAIKALRAGVASVPDPQRLETELASLYVKLGKPGDAEQVYQSALQRDPRSDVAANNLAMLLVTYQKDRTSLDRAQALTERFAHSDNVSFMDTYGWVLYKRGDAAAAIPVLQSVLAKTPDSEVSMYHLGMAQAAAGQSKAARDNLERALKAGERFEGADEAKATLDKLANLPRDPASRPKS